MSHFTLLVLPDGRGLLTTEEDITADEAQGIRSAFEHWRESDTGIAIIANCSVERVNSIDLDLPFHMDGMIQ